ncbi:hypothetical protein Droror1_Dr00015544 [Drosera rotundifolia]
MRSSPPPGVQSGHRLRVVSVVLQQHRHSQSHRSLSPAPATFPRIPERAAADREEKGSAAVLAAEVERRRRSPAQPPCLWSAAIFPSRSRRASRRRRAAPSLHSWARLHRGSFGTLQRRYQRKEETFSSWFAK